jgi:hypothetical protein
MKLRIKLICEPRLWRRVSIVAPATLFPVGDPDFSERSSLRRRPKQKNHNTKATAAPTPTSDPMTIPAMAPPLSDELLPWFDDEVPDVAEDDVSETVIVTRWPESVCTEMVGEVVVVDEELYTWQGQPCSSIKQFSPKIIHTEASTDVAKVVLV